MTTAQLESNALGWGDGSADPIRSMFRHLGLGLLVLNALVAVGCVLLLSEVREAGQKEARSQVSTIARLVETNTSAMLDQTAVALASIGAHVEAQLASSAVYRPSLDDVTDLQISRITEIQHIAVFDETGRQSCNLQRDRCSGIDIVDRPYFLRLREHPETPIAIYGPYTRRVDDQSVMVMARALKRRSGEFAGVVAALLPVENFCKMFDDVDLGANGIVSLRTADLDLVARLPERSASAASSFALSPKLLSAVSMSPLAGVSLTVSPIDGVERVVAHRRMAHYPLYALVGKASDDFLAPWRRLGAWIAGLFIMFAIASLKIAHVGTRGLRRQERVQRLYDEAPCGYHSLDSRGLYIRINDTELNWLGCSRSDVINKLRPSDFFTDEGRQNFGSVFRDLARTGTVEGAEFDLVSRDGTTRRVIVGVKAMRDQTGEMTASNAVMHDITRLHHARTQVEALAQEQGVMLDTELIGIVKLKDRQVVWCNQGMDRLFGYGSDELVGMSSRVLYPDDESFERYGREYQTIYADGGHYRAQLQMLRKDGSQVWIDASGTRLSAEHNEVMMLLADISALKLAEEERVRANELEAQNAHLRETSRMKDYLVANLSHELRTPLNAVIGFSHMLNTGAVGPDSPKFQSHLSRIGSAGTQLLSMIEAMLDYARFEAKKMELHATTVNVRDSLVAAVDMCRAECQAKRVSIDLIVSSEPTTVELDPMRLRQLLLVLLSNAIKFSHPGGRVEVRTAALADDRWTVEIEDHGIGISEVDLPKLFSAFVQLDEGSKKSYPGTGLGLALACRIVRAQGGTLVAESVRGQGSVFRATLPRTLPQI